MNMEEIHEEKVETCVTCETASSDDDREMENSGETNDILAPPSDPFAYVNKIQTNELWKLHVTQIPKYIGYQAFKKKMAHLGLNTTKIKLLGQGSDAYAFIVFKSEEDMNKGFKVLDGYKWKSSVLQVKYGKPAADPYVKSRQQQQRPYGEASQVKNRVIDDPVMAKLNAIREMPDGEEKKREISKLLSETTEPWYLVPYDEQLSQKNSAMKAIVKPLMSNNVEFRDIVASPVVDNYRNKVEFTIGFDFDGKPSVGFRLGSYAKGSVYVIRPDAGACKIVPLALSKLAEAFELYIRDELGPLRPFNQITHEGNYRFLTCRINSSGEILAIISLFTGNLESNLDVVDKERAALRSYFDETKRKELGLVGLMWNSLNTGSSGDDFGSQSGPQLIFGQTFIIESLCDLKFKISPESFFQINTKCTESLYSMVREFAFEGEENKPKLALDLCCGTGTIGIVLASAQSEIKVVGIELCESAVNDAKGNAELNNISNERISFICDKVEKALYGVLSKCEECKNDTTGGIVAILDPPRAGVHTSVIQTIRRTTAIKRVVFVSCNPSAAFANFQHLTGEPSRRLLGDPFVLKRVVPVDLFPHTQHCELVLVFER